MAISEFQFRQLLLRTKRPDVDTNAVGAVERESDLHDEITNYCKLKGWICIHSRMDRKQTANLGTPDFIVALDDGRTIYAEAKRKGGKLSTAQQATLAWLLQNKQTAGVVTSLREFCELCGVR